MVTLARTEGVEMVEGVASSKGRTTVNRFSRERTGQPQTRADEVYLRLRELILTTTLAPGQPLVESELISSLDVGRTPLRDALRLLSHEGLVRIEPRRGTTVSPLTSSDLHAIFEIRVAIEPVIAAIAVIRANEKDVNQVAGLVERAERNPSRDEDSSLDEALHATLLRIADNRFLSDFYQRLWSESLRFRYWTNSGMDGKEDQIDFARRVLAALRDRNQAELTGVLVAHVEDFHKRVWTAIVSSNKDGSADIRASRTTIVD